MQTRMLRSRVPWMGDTLPGVALGLWAAAIALAPSVEWKLSLLAPGIGIAILAWTLQRPGRWLYLFFLAALALPPLPGPGGDSGIHPAPLAAGIGLFFGLLRLPVWKHVHGSLPMAFLALVGIFAASSAFAAFYSGPQIALGSIARVVLFSIGVYVFCYARIFDYPEPWPMMRFLFVLATLAAAFACVDFYYQFPAPAGYGPQFVWLDQGVFRRAQGLFYEASTLGNFCSFFLTFVMVCLFRPKADSPIARAALIGSGAIFAAALIFSYSRGSIVNLLISASVLLWLRRSSIPLRKGRMIAVLVGLPMMAAVVVQVVFPAFSSNYWARIIASVQYVSSSPDSVLSGRLTNWAFLLKFLGREPWAAILGIGYKTLPYSDAAGAPVVADNTYLQLLVETGVVGLAAFCALNWAILRTGLRAARSATLSSQVAGEWIFCFWAGQIVQMCSGDLITYWRVLPVYFWVLAIAARHDRNECATADH